MTAVRTIATGVQEMILGGYASKTTWLAGSTREIFLQGTTAIRSLPTLNSMPVLVLLCGQYVEEAHGHTATMDVQRRRNSGKYIYHFDRDTLDVGSVR